MLGRKRDIHTGGGPCPNSVINPLARIHGNCEWGTLQLIPVASERGEDGWNRGSEKQFRVTSEVGSTTGI